MRKLALVLLIAALIGVSACREGPAASANTWQDQYDLGMRYLEEGNYEEAIIAFSAAIEIDPKRAEAYLGLADAYIESGKPEKALEALQCGYDNTEDVELDQRMDALQAELEATDAEWKNAYATYIQKDMLETGDGSTLDGSEYYLFFGNDDHIPELYISYPYTYAGARMCTVLNGVVDAVYVESVSYVERENLFHDAGGRMDNYYDRIYAIQDGKFSSLAEGAETVYQWAEDPADIVADYTWNGQAIEGMAYKANLEDAFPSASAKSCMDTNSYTYEGVLNYLQNGTPSEPQPASSAAPTDYVIRRAPELDGVEANFTLGEAWGTEPFTYVIEEMDSGFPVATFQVKGYDYDDIEVIYHGEDDLIFSIPVGYPASAYRYDFTENMMYELDSGNYQLWGEYLLNAGAAAGEMPLPGFISLYTLRGEFEKTLAENPCFLQYYIDGNVLYYVYSNHTYEEMMEYAMGEGSYTDRTYRFEVWAYDQASGQNTRINEFDAYYIQEFQDGKVVFETDSGVKSLAF